MMFLKNQHFSEKKTEQDDLQLRQICHNYGNQLK